MQTSRRRQPQRIPPPITHGEDSLDALVVLRELPDDLALVGWKTIRSVRLWAELPPEERGAVFAPDALAARLLLVREIESPELRGALEDAARVLAPDPAQPAEVADACGRLAAWADERGASGAALEFLQAGALVLPSDAVLAHAVARLARRRAEFARAETWYRQAIFAARRSRDRETLARAYCGLGTTFMLRGSYPAARQALIRALRAARRHALHPIAALISHELAVIGIRTDQAAEVFRFARAALEGYGAGHPRLPALAHDVAVFWMNRGYFAAALGVFEAIPASFGEPADRLILAASRARAAGGAGERDAFAAAWQAALDLVDRPEAAERASTALVELARGAAFLEEWQRAEEAAGRALELARARGEGEKALEAESVLESARRGARKGAPRSRSVRAPRQVQWLARELVARLPAAAGANRTPPPPPPRGWLRCSCRIPWSLPGIRSR
jgi:tetratricopeptide (TPR) repeat protein